MARSVLTGPPNNWMPFNTGDSTERGQHPKEVVDALNAMTTELYAATAAASASLVAAAKYTKNTNAGATVAAVGDMTGALTVTAEYSAIGASTLTTRTAAQMFADAGAVVGQAYELAIMNSGAGTVTLTAGTGVTITGTATLATNTVRWFVVTFNSSTTLTIQNAGSGAV